MIYCNVLNFEIDHYHNLLDKAHFIYDTHKHMTNSVNTAKNEYIKKNLTT